VASEPRLVAPVLTPRQNERAGGSIQPVDVEVLVSLNITAACTNVHVQRNWRFDELRVVREELAFALTGEIPDKAKARRRRCRRSC
jgi:hypothetical protein